MGEVGDLPPAVLRALDGIADGSGRTVVVSGPEASGKSELVDSLLHELVRRGVPVRRLHGSYRDRNTPSAVVRPLESDAEEAAGSHDTDEGDESATSAPDEDGSMPISALAYVPLEPGPSRRARGERQRGRVLGVPFAARTRGVERIDPAEYWERIGPDLRNPDSAGLAIAVEDAAYADDESRNFLLFLAERTAFVPLLLVLVLDSSNPAHGEWESRLAPVAGVEWVRTRRTRVDPREASRVRRIVENLPPASRRVVVLLGLLDGTASEVKLARVARLTFPELADALLPAAEAHLVKVEPGKVSLLQGAWAEFVPTLFPEEEVRRLHREIAEALEALHPEPSLADRREYASHFVESEASPVALRHLLAGIGEERRAASFDGADALIGRALSCIPSLPPPDRARARAELSWLRCEALLYSGRTAEVGHDLREAIDASFRDRGGPGRVVEWLEPLIPAFLAVGPRPGLLTELGELAERLDRAEQWEAEALLGWVLAESEVARGRLSKGTHEAHRTVRLARRQPTPILRALALVAGGAVAAAAPDGNLDDIGRQYEAAAVQFDELRRTVLDLIAQARVAGLARRRGALDAALSIHRKAIPTLQGLRLPAIEIDHQLGCAEILFDRSPESAAERPIARAGEIARLLTLTPPAPARLRLWVLEGRLGAREGQLDRARDRWLAVAAARGVPITAPIRVEAIVRLATLESLHGRADRAAELFGGPEVVRAFPAGRPPFDEWARGIQNRSAIVRDGAGPISALLADAGV